ncbi:type IV pilus twitching motility protein PilT [Microgenomates group bacterium]|nr:type IV pilus twitching motility protein PilT [Microgenomates group bacterium]
MELLVQQEGSDIHLKHGLVPHVRLSGELTPVNGYPVLGSSELDALILPMMNDEQRQAYETNKEIDFGYQYFDKGRFRVNVFHAMGERASVLRLIPSRIKTMDELNLPEVMKKLTKYRQGMVLVTGPTGEGKSTTLASMINEINYDRGEHILTIEDPIEFVYKPNKSIISQRELELDTKSWLAALKSALREDPNILLVGEMRDYETIGATITVAETGHLVFATLHTATAAQTIDRIVDVFPGHQQGQIRQQLAANLNAVISQRLLPRIGGGRVASFEIMVNNGAIRNLIREAKTHQIDNIIQTSADEGNMLMENYLFELVQKNQISQDDAMRVAFRPEFMARLLGFELAPDGSYK